MTLVEEPFKNEWTKEMAREIDRYWGTCALEMGIHLVEAVGCLQSCMSGDSVLEVGCGTGRIYAVLKHSTIGSYTGIDLSQGMLEVFKETHPEANVAIGDATHLSFADKSFDVSICLEVLRHITQYEKAIQELYRVAKKAAIFTIEVTQGPSVYKGEDRNSSYIQADKQYVHYQLEHNSSQFLAWLGEEFKHEIDIKVISSNKWMFVINKNTIGLSWKLSPLCGLDRLNVALSQALADQGRWIGENTGKRCRLLISTKIHHVMPLEIEFKRDIIMEDIPEGETNECSDPMRGLQRGGHTEGLQEVRTT